MCLAVGEGTRDKAGWGVTERGGHNGTAEKAPGRSKFIPLEREVWPRDSK